MTPTLDDLKSARLTYRPGDLFNPPALTNFIGSLQTGTCVSAIQHLTFPPFSQGDTVIGALTVNGVGVSAAGVPVSYVWRPDRVVRQVELGSLEIKSTTVMAVRGAGVTVRIDVKNGADELQDVVLRIRTGAGVIQSKNGWHTPYSPKEGAAISVTPWEGTPPPETLVENVRTALPDGDGILYTSRTSNACSLQGVSPKPTTTYRSWFEYEFQLSPGEQRRLYYFVGLGAAPEKVKQQFKVWKDNPDGSIEAAERDWAEELSAVFTPGNDRYSGWLPTLTCSDPAVEKIYLTAILGVVYHKRLGTNSAYGQTFVTLMPRYWVTTSFINDWSMSAWLLAMLDPDVVRKQVELWLGRDIYSHFGTEYVSGSNSGNWYSCNDFAMLRLISAYVRVTGNREWLSTLVAGETVLDHCRKLAHHYRSLGDGTGLADYGDRNSLLEAVGSYTNVVASLNATNVWNLRELAWLEEVAGFDGKSASLLSGAQQIVTSLLTLYVPAAGYWNVRHPDGGLVPVRHAWDFVHTLNFLDDDLVPEQVEEMIQFFEEELLSPSWMAALSPLDEDVSFSLRPDHQWNGSWPGWVALAASALVKHGRQDILARWIPGLARSAGQGPYSQAHFVEHAAPTVAGGARKAPTEWPYITDWATMCVGGFFELVVLHLFGLRFEADEITSTPNVALPGFEATLENVPFHGTARSFSTDG